jgi:His-Xaa-Ser system protein HxsD
MGCREITTSGHVPADGAGSGTDGANGKFDAQALLWPGLGIYNSGSFGPYWQAKGHFVDSLPFIVEKGGALCATVDLRIYGQAALLKAVHRFTGRCYLHLQHRDEYLVNARFQPKQAQECRMEELAGEFFNELLDQRLRAIVQQESEAVRNLILAHALSRTSLISPEEEIAASPVTVTDDRTANRQPPREQARGLNA